MNTKRVCKTRVGALQGPKTPRSLFPHLPGVHRNVIKSSERTRSELWESREREEEGSESRRPSLSPYFWQARVNRRHRDRGPLVIFQAANWLSVIINGFILRKRDKGYLNDRIFLSNIVIDILLNIEWQAKCGITSKIYVLCILTDKLTSE